MFGMDAEVFAQVKDAVRELVREAVVPREEEIDLTDRIPDELRAAAAEMGLFGYALPEEYGGLGVTMSEDVQLAFEFGYTTPAFRSLFGTNNGIAGQVIARFGDEEQKKTFLPRLAAGALPFLGRRILIVDHDSDFLEVLSLVLEGLGAKVYEATSAGSALESLITRRPDLLISDLRMGGMDGFGLVEAVRALPESLGGRTPAIALSGAPVSVLPRVLSSGFQAFLQKPLNENELLLAVPALVERHSLAS